MTTLAGLAPAVALLFAGLYWYRAERLWKRWQKIAEEAQNARDDLAAELTASSADLKKLMESSESSSKLLTEAGTKLETLSETLEHERRRVKNLQGLIASVVDQRQFWAEWYHRQVAEHGAAQNVLLGEVSRLAFHVKQLGGKAEIRPGIQRIIEEFSGVHPSLADDGKPSAPDLKPLAERKIEGSP